MSLTHVEYGSLASSEVMNNNFSYLEDKIIELTELLNTNISSLRSNLSTINTRMEDITEEIQENMDSIDIQLSNYKNKTKILVKNSTMVPNWNGCRTVSNLNSYTVNSNGYLLILPVSNASGNIKINGATVTVKVRSNNYDNASDLIVLPLKENDVVVCNIDYSVAYFVPTANITVEGF